MKIRVAETCDSTNIIRVYNSAFPAPEVDVVAQLAIALLEEQALSLVAVVDNTIVGNIVFSHVEARGSDCEVSILAPLAVSPKYQRSGIGSQLIQAGMRLLVEQNVDVVLVYGDPKYYKKFGFTTKNNMYIAPYTLEYPTAWQYAVLTECSEYEPCTITCAPSLMNAELW